MLPKNKESELQSEEVKDEDDILGLPRSALQPTQYQDLHSEQSDISRYLLNNNANDNTQQDLIYTNQVVPSGFDD